MKYLLNQFNALPVQVRAGFAFLLCTVFQRAFTIVTTPIFTRLLTTYEYGKYSVFTSWLGILSCFVTMSISAGIYSQAIVKFDDKRKQYSSAMQGLSFSLIIGWLCVYLLANEFWNSLFSLETPQMFAMFVIMWANAVFGFWSTEQRVEYKYKHLLLVTLLVSVLQPVVCVLFIHIFVNKVTGLVWGIAVTGVVLYFYLFYVQQRDGKVFFSKSIWSYSLRLALPLIPHYLSMVVLNSADRIMIENMVGASAAGIYNLAYTISMCGLLINQAMLQTFSPWLYYKIKNQQFYDIKKITYPVLIFIASINLIIILFTPEILSFFAPPSYWAAMWVMPPITMSVFFMFSYNLFSAFEFYYEKTHYVSIATVTGSILNVILNYIFIKRYGYLAAGYTTLFCYFSFAVIHYYFMIKICKKDIDNVKVYDLKTLCGISAAFLLLGFLIMCIFRYPALRYSLMCFTVIGVFVKRKNIIGFISRLIYNKKEATNY